MDMDQTLRPSARLVPNARHAREDRDDGRAEALEQTRDLGQLRRARLGLDERLGLQGQESEDEERTDLALAATVALDHDRVVAVDVALQHSQRPIQSDAARTAKRRHMSW